MTDQPKEQELKNIFPVMEQHAIKEIIERFNGDCEMLLTDQGIVKLMEYNKLKYKNNQLKKCVKFLNRVKDKAIYKVKKQLSEVSDAKEFTGDLIITLEWTKSYMWGSNPTAYTNYGFKSGSIGGCGYCKTSTATAYALNSDNRILKLLYQAKENALKLPSHKLRIKNQYYEQDSNEKVYRTEKMSESDINRAFLGYGTGYGVIPRFEGGVGVSSHENSLRRLGLIMQSITDTKSVNVYRVYTEVKQ